jgi:LuxR family maltose regulon positive regulatory protein
LALLHWIQGDYQEAHDWMDEALRACRWDPSFLHALRARIWLDKAIQWADTRVLEDPGDYSWELQSLVRVRIAQYRAYGAPDLMPVQAVLDEHLEVTALPSSGWQVQVLTLKALLFQALGRVDEAMLWLARALPIARETGRVLIFLEYGPPMVELLQEAVRRDIEVGYARQVLDAFEARGRAEIRPVPGGMPSAPAVLIEPLSERERQVLRLLATTLSGPEIADQLSISLSTFRSHTKSIYGKLDVHSRLDAVARATELNLLPN